MTEDRIVTVEKQINESADKIRVDTKIKRGTGTRDQDEFKITVKGNDASEVVGKVNAVIEELRETSEVVRKMQPDEGDA